MTALIKWIGKVTTIVLIILVLLAVLFNIISLMSGGTPQVFGYELLVVLSGSMEPAIKTGSVIAIQPTTNNDRFQVGDVITYRSADDSQTFITHRIQQIEHEGFNEAYVTKGDSNRTADPAPVPSANIVGKYTNFTIPYVGYLFSFAKSKVGIVLFMIIPGVCLMIASFVDVWRIISQSDKETSEVKSG